MTLRTDQLEAGWHEVESGEFGKWVAERTLSRPGATSSVIRVEAATSRLLCDAVTLRQSQLEGAEERTKDTITNDGTLVTGEQHEALRTDGVVVPSAEGEAEATVDETLAARDAEIESLRAQLAEAQTAAEADPPEAPETEQTSGSETPPSDSEQTGANSGSSEASPAEPQA